MAKTITVGGQSIVVERFSDVYRNIIIAMAQQETYDFAQLSTVIEAAAELFAESLPANLYKQKKTKYFWVGSEQELFEFLNGLYRVYWEYELDEAVEQEKQSQIDLAKSQIQAVDVAMMERLGQVAKAEIAAEVKQQPSLISAELEAELTKIKNEYAVIAE